ncbi:hypothetical protein PthstB1num2_25790 [Parageobacillus thermoglucosidasius]|nr:hypothetical protein PTHTG4_17610 [Parageobacillus thermoglucosidasius]GMO00540.1 hypothetical protein PthstB1num2_25790 [Parageobacillus thermoglucosidasius]
MSDNAENMDMQAEKASAGDYAAAQKKKLL